MKRQSTIKGFVICKRYLCCILVLFFILTSCNNTKNANNDLLEDKQSNEEGNPVSPSNEDANPVTTGDGKDNLGSTVNENDNPSSTDNEEDDLLDMGDPDKNYRGILGYGYNVVAKGYFNEDDLSSGGKILDTDKLSKKGYIYRKSRVVQNSITTAGNSMKSYQQDESQNISGSFSYGLFSKIKLDFSLTSYTDSSSISKNVYIKDKIRVIKEREYIDSSDLEIKDLINYTKSKFRKALNKDVSSQSPEEQKKYYYNLFEQYGTHVLLDILLGGRIDMNYVYNNTQSKSISSIKTDVGIVFKSFKTKVSGELSETEKKIVEEFTENTTLISNRYGGTVEGGIHSISDMAAVFNDWTKSFTDRSTYEFIDIGDGFSTALLGIWELADTEEITDTVYDMYCLYLQEAGQYFADFDDKSDKSQYIKMFYSNGSNKSFDARSGIESTISHKEPNTPYYILPNDLWAGIKDSKYCYLAYTYTTKQSEAIRDIRILSFNNDSTTPDTITLNNCTYHKHDFNINQYGKVKLMLYYTTDKQAGAPIREIGVENNNGYTFGSTATGWTSILNNSYSTNQEKLEDEKNWQKVPINVLSLASNSMYLWFKR